MAIQQHPIPQNVTSFQFRLVGDMTLKQFFQLAGGAIVGLIFYATGLPFFFKWPLIGLSVGLGAGMAFLPISGRPMDQWLMAFFRSIYQPTIFTWSKTVEPIEPKPSQQVTPPPAKPIGGKVEYTPMPTVRPETEIRMETPSVSFQPTGAVMSSVPVTPPARPLPPATETPTIKKVVSTAQVAPIRIQPQAKPVAPEAPAGPRPQAIPQVPTQMASSQTTINTTSTPVFSSTLPIPSTPQAPNIVVGMTLTPAGKILEGAIVEIRFNNTTVRATKSNKLGQFMFLKPLDNGVYHLTAERDGFTFPTFSLMIGGSVVLPIKLQATAEVPTTIVAPKTAIRPSAMSVMSAGPVPQPLRPTI